LRPTRRPAATSTSASTPSKAAVRVGLGQLPLRLGQRDARAFQRGFGVGRPRFGLRLRLSARQHRLLRRGRRKFGVLDRGGTAHAAVQKVLLPRQRAGAQFRLAAGGGHILDRERQARAGLRSVRSRHRADRCARWQAVPRHRPGRSAAGRRPPPPRRHPRKPRQVPPPALRRGRAIPACGASGSRRRRSGRHVSTPGESVTTSAENTRSRAGGPPPSSASRVCSGRPDRAPGKGQKADGQGHQEQPDKGAAEKSHGSTLSLCG
jgi:hypothetical protein